MEEERELYGRATQDESRKRAVRRLTRAQVVYLAALMVFAVFAVFAHLYAYFGWDLTAARDVQSIQDPVFTNTMSVVSFFGSGWMPFALVSLTGSLFLITGWRSEAAAILFSAGGGELLNRIIKIIIARPRPETGLVIVLVHPNSQSFPSGHVTFYVCYFGLLFFIAYARLPRASIARRAALTITALLVALVGLSRVYLGAHWPSDTIGAYLFGGLWLALSVHLYQRWKERATFHLKAVTSDE